jgi:hypothetical protein
MKEKIKDLIYEIELENEKRQKTSIEEVRALNKIISLAQQLCDHSETKYYPDPSGNNDSCYCCLICGLEKKRF